MVRILSDCRNRKSRARDSPLRRADGQCRPVLRSLTIETAMFMQRFQMAIAAAGIAVGGEPMQQTSRRPAKSVEPAPPPLSARPNCRRRIQSAARSKTMRCNRSHGGPRVVPPKGAPNVLLIITDDVGFGVPSTFGGVFPDAGDWIASPQRGLRYNRISPRHCARRRARR